MLRKARADWIVAPPALTMSRSRIASLLALIGLLAGCAQYPMGMTKSEWEALTPGQRARYQQLEAGDQRLVPPAPGRP